MKWTEKEFDAIDVIMEREFDLDPANMDHAEIASFVSQWSNYFPQDIIEKAQSCE